MSNRIKELRMAKGWSQEELADRAGICTQSVIRYEGGHFGQLWVALAICKALGKYLDEVFYYDVKEGSK